MVKKNSLIGQVFGRLTVIGWAVPRKNRQYWHCQCECGKKTIVNVASLRYGGSKSCGCLRGKIRHGYARKKGKTYNSWVTMKQRCYNPNLKSYIRYGGRGIRVCDAWLNSFESFLSDMGESTNGRFLRRFDLDGDYSPQNCFWGFREVKKVSRPIAPTGQSNFAQSLSF